MATITDNGTTNYVADTEQLAFSPTTVAVAAAAAPAPTPTPVPTLADKFGFTKPMVIVTEADRANLIKPIADVIAAAYMDVKLKGSTQDSQLWQGLKKDMNDSFGQKGSDILNAIFHKMDEAGGKNAKSDDLKQIVANFLSDVPLKKIIKYASAINPDLPTMEVAREGAKTTFKDIKGPRLESSAQLVELKTPILDLMHPQTVNLQKPSTASAVSHDSGTAAMFLQSANLGDGLGRIVQSAISSITIATEKALQTTTNAVTAAATPSGTP